MEENTQRPDRITKLAANPSMGGEVIERPPYCHYTAKYRKSRWANGHRIVYQETSEGIEIIRILHGKMHLPDHLEN